MPTTHDDFNRSNSFDGMDRGGNDTIKSLLIRTIEDRVARALGDME